MRSNLWRAGGIAAGVFCALGLTVMVQAHAKLEKSEPADKATITAPPPHVELWFNEKPDVKTSKIELRGASGPVTLGPVHSMAPKTLMAVVSGEMPDGSYTTSWQTAGDDGHVLKGQFTFALKRVKQ
jgi:methionine-rich copper-binding protein CopC